MGGGMGGPGMAKALEGLQKKLREDAEKMNDRLDESRIDGSSGGGMVKAVVDGHGHLIEVTISPDVVDPTDVEMLQDLVVTAVREALEKAETIRNEEQEKMIPKIPGLPPGLF